LTLPKTISRYWAHIRPHLQREAVILEGIFPSQIQIGGDFTFSAPAAYLGNQSGALGGVFSYDLFHNGSVNIQTADVIIEGGGIRLLWQSDPALIPTSAWQHVSLTLSPSPQWHVGATGIAATNADFATALSSVTGFYIRGEYTYGIQESSGIDNVSLERLLDADLLASIHCSAVDICWAGRTNQMYQVQYRTNISDTNWFDFGSPLPGTGTNCVSDGINGQQQRFYRIVRVP